MRILPVIQEILNGDSSTVTKNPTIHNPIASFSNDILRRKSVGRRFELSESIPPPPTEMRHLRAHIPAPAERRRISSDAAAAHHCPSALATGDPIRVDDDAVVGLPDLDLDFGLPRVVHDLLDFLGDHRSVDIGGRHGRLRRRRRFGGGLAVGAMARGDADGEEEESDDDEGPDEDPDDHP